MPLKIINIIAVKLISYRGVSDTIKSCFIFFFVNLIMCILNCQKIK